MKKKRKSPTQLQVVRRVFPKATKPEALNLLWGRTAFPMESRIGRIVASLRAHKRLLKAGKTPCDFCEKEASEGDSCCERCEQALAAARQDRD
jgi:hypothetical protein